MTPEGLRIQILDEDRQPMFATGSAALNERARLLLQKVAPVLMKLPEDISIAGHTDATPYHSQDRSNWELSTERANATRRLMVEAGLPETRIRNVTGNADRDPLLPAEPTAAANRRIAIVVLRACAVRTAKIRLAPRPLWRHVPPPLERIAMLTLAGLGVLFGCVFGSYVLSGGSMEPLIEAIPFEMLTIGGAALATFIMANSMHDVKHTLGGFGKIMKGAVFGKADYVELLCLLFYFVRLASTKGNMALEPHIEKPAESAAFQKFPKILANHHATAIICDYLRMVGMNARRSEPDRGRDGRGS